MLLLIAALLVFTLVGTFSGRRFGGREMAAVVLIAIVMTVLYAALPNRFV